MGREEPVESVLFYVLRLGTDGSCRLVKFARQ
jgi:hypothetical protein